MKTALDQGAHLHGWGGGLKRKQLKIVVQRTYCYLICWREFIFNPIHPTAVQRQMPFFFKL